MLGYVVLKVNFLPFMPFAAEGVHVVPCGVYHHGYKTCTFMCVTILITSCSAMKVA